MSLSSMPSHTALATSMVVSVRVIGASYTCHSKAVALATAYMMVALWLVQLSVTSMLSSKSPPLGLNTGVATFSTTSLPVAVTVILLIQTL